MRSSAYRAWIVLAAILIFPAATRAEVDFKKAFGDRDGCFLIRSLRTGEVVAQYNARRCRKRFSPCSSFKIPAAIMAFEKGVFKDETQVIPWDGVRRERPELNQDQTPFTWMNRSAKWVTEWIMPRLGEKAIQRFLADFSYGNRDFSAGLKDAWQTTSLKISAREQVAFLSRLWKEELPVSKRTAELTKKIIFIKKLGKGAELYGKTGTGCLVGHECMDRPDKMIGWFVGVLETGSDSYVFAANASDLKPQGPPAGPRLRETTIDILKQMGLVSG